MKTMMWLAVILQISAGALWAGPTAHINGPSEDFQGYMDPAMTVAVNLAHDRDDSGARPATVTGLGLVNGFLSSKKFNLEAGFDYKSCGDLADDNPLYFNAKAGFPEGALGEKLPAVVAGIFDVGTNGRKTDYNVFYAMAGKTAELRAFNLGKFSAGWFNGNGSLLRNKDDEKDKSGLMAAWDRVMPEISEKLWVSVDYLGTKSAYGSWNFGLAWKFNSRVSGIAGFNRFTSSALVDTYNVQLTLGLGGDGK